MLPSSLTNLKRHVAGVSCLFSSALMLTEGRHFQTSGASLRSAGQRSVFSHPNVSPALLLVCHVQICASKHIKNLDNLIQECPGKFCSASFAHLFGGLFVIEARTLFHRVMSLRFFVLGVRR